MAGKHGVGSYVISQMCHDWFFFSFVLYLPLYYLNVFNILFYETMVRMSHSYTAGAIQFQGKPIFQKTTCLLSWTRGLAVSAMESGQARKGHVCSWPIVWKICNT